MPQLTPAVILAERDALYGDAPSPARAAELATEVARMVQAVRDASRRLVLEDEPSTFVATLKSLA